MGARKPSPSAGQTLKELRERLGLSTRDVEARSRDIADEHHNREFYISHTWVTDIENGQLKPSIYKLHTLSTIYKVGYHDVLACFVYRSANSAALVLRSVSLEPTYWAARRTLKTRS